MKIVIVGGGAAGFFAAITCAEKNPEYEVLILEKTDKLLSKVRISGGGRCNVTHACFDSKTLVQQYPRGQKALLGPFSRFQPEDTIQWFSARGVVLKTEADGRIFPISDSSQTIVDCLIQGAENAGVRIWKQTCVTGIQKQEGTISLRLENGNTIKCDRLLVATGGHPKASGYNWLQQIPQNIIPPVPSLFTFNLKDPELNDLAGVSVEHARIKVHETKLVNEGPLLVTHWGLSGPLVLKLSALAARILAEKNYDFSIEINWLGNWADAQVFEKLALLKTHEAKKQMNAFSPFQMPLRLWKYLLSRSEIPNEIRWADLSKKQFNVLTEILLRSNYNVKGKTTFKEEFVTCGGVALENINLKTMESIICPGIFFAGEVLDIDGVTGGFNFQNAWTTGWIAGSSMAESESTVK
jgi:predicted Rossmann fold flavoprotein